MKKYEIEIKKEYYLNDPRIASVVTDKVNNISYLIDPHLIINHYLGSEIYVLGNYRKCFKDHVDIFSEIYNNSTSPNKFTIVEEVTSVKRSVSSTIYLKRYVVTALTNNGTQVYLSCSSDTSEVYFSSFKFRSLNYKNEKDAEYFLDVYKDILKDRYKKELLDTMKVLEVEENINYERTGYYIDVNGL